MSRAGTAGRFHGADVCGSTSPPGRTSGASRSFGGGDRTVGSVHPGPSRSAGVPSRAWPRAGEQARDLRRSPGPRGGHAATETDRRQPRQPTSEVPETNGSNVSGTNQLVLESIDTVGVRSSILRSPTLNPPDSGGFSHFRTTVGPCWGHASVGWRWIGPGRAWPRDGPPGFLRLTRPVGRTRRHASHGGLSLWYGAAGVGHGEQRQVVAGIGRSVHRER